MARLTARRLNEKLGDQAVAESIAETRRFIAAEIVRAGELLRSVNYQPE